MHRIQIYFNKPLFKALKRQANILDLSPSAYIKEVLKIEKIEKKTLNFLDFSGMRKEREIDQKIIREKAWK